MNNKAETVPGSEVALLRMIGAAYPAVTAAIFEKAELFVPLLALLKRFGDATIPIAEQAHILRRQITNLRRTRDLLLPHLLSRRK